MIITGSFSIGLLLCSLIPCAGTVDSLIQYTSTSSPNQMPDLSTERSRVQTRAVKDDKNVELYFAITKMLEQLNVLSPNAKSCYILKKVEPTNVKPAVDKTVEIRLVFSVASAQSSSSGNNKPKEDSNNSNRNSSECKKLLALSMQQSPLGSNSGANDSVNNSAGLSAPHTEYGNESGQIGEEIDQGTKMSRGKRGLSRTQMFIIVTCSSVIGLFFLVAAIIRIRNYVHRLREEQAIAKRPTFRSCNVALRNSTGSSELLRRETGSSASPSKVEDERNSGNGNSIQNSPKQTASTDNPMYLITPQMPQADDKTAAVQSPASSIKYIDEDDTSKKGYETDEAEDEGESESKPLLASEVANSKDNDSKESNVAPVQFGNSLAFENFPNNNNANTTEENVNEDLADMASEDATSLNQIPVSNANIASPDIAWLEQAVEDSTLGSVTAGLTQSDSSLSSSNKFYSYGTGQLEYVSPYQGPSGEYASSSSISSPSSEKGPHVLYQPILPGKTNDGSSNVSPAFRDNIDDNVLDNEQEIINLHPSLLDSNIDQTIVTDTDIFIDNIADDEDLCTDNNNPTDNFNNLPCNMIISSEQDSRKENSDSCVVMDVEGNYTHPTNDFISCNVSPAAKINTENQPQIDTEDENPCEHTTSSLPPSPTSSTRSTPGIMGTLPPMATGESEML
ncbi:uncharacterized protein LOC115217999 isoform X1 [Octopus sinensis]|uniref:Uncharacterized protein LOC115217999 isoform X1 n=1 Tax=Octopus sinensis TaxID=2607531 RepID=A0A6P7SYW9_9MOLL|nr:uncharacterized protein LOC115217999 isoform X1 [Octopus sinensis]